MLAQDPENLAGIVRLRNDSGANRARWDILGVSGVVFDPADNLQGFQSEQTLTGVTPDATTHKGKFVILLEPILSGKVGLAVAAGVCPVHVDVSDAGHAFADAASSAANLASGTSGVATILWKASGTGVVWAVVRLGGSGAAAGTADSPAVLAHDAAEAAKTDTWDRDNPAAGTDGVAVKKQTRTVYNAAGDKVLYAFYRTFTYDSAGNLKSVSAESRGTVDTPGACL